MSSTGVLSERLCQGLPGGYRLCTLDKLLKLVALVAGNILKFKTEIDERFSFPGLPAAAHHPACKIFNGLTEGAVQESQLGDCRQGCIVACQTST